MGGYNENFPYAGFEDYDLTKRLLQNNIKIYIQPKNVAYHNEVDRMNILQWLARRKRGGKTRQVAVQMGHKELTLHYSKLKARVFEFVIGKQQYFLKALQWVPNIIIFDRIYFFIVNLLYAASVYEGYQEKKNLKPTVLHIIDSLGIGGAETLLVNANIHLNGYDHVVVYLNGTVAYGQQLQNVSVHYLHFSGWISLIPAVLKLRKIIRQYQVKLVHSHLYYSIIIARLACPQNVPLISSYHSLLYDPANKAQYSWKLLWLGSSNLSQMLLYALCISGSAAAGLCKCWH